MTPLARITWATVRAWCRQVAAWSVTTWSLCEWIHRTGSWEWECTRYCQLKVGPIITKQRQALLVFVLHTAASGHACTHINKSMKWVRISPHSLILPLSSPSSWWWDWIPASRHPGNRGDLFRCENSSLFIIREWIRPMIDYPTQCNQELRAWQGQTACGQVELLDPLRVARATYSVASLLLHGGRESAPNMTTDPAWAARTMSIWFTLEEWSIYPAIQPKHWSNWLII